MQKLYGIVRVMMIFVLLFAQNALQAQKCCVERQAGVKVVSEKQVLLEKIDIKEGTLLTDVNTNVYVSYRSGNANKFWGNVTIATIGIIVSNKLAKSTNESKMVNAVSPIVPLGISAATLPSIWKNRPRGVPKAGLYIQHRNIQGKLIKTWEKPLSQEAQNGAELLTIAIDKPLSEGSLEVYLQNGSKNEVYYWGVQNLKNIVKKVSIKQENAIKTQHYSMSQCNPRQGEVQECESQNNKYWDDVGCVCLTRPSCDGMEPAQAECASSNGQWDSDECQCVYQVCLAPQQEKDHCNNLPDGSYWNENSCQCVHPAVSLPPVIVTPPNSPTNPNTPGGGGNPSNPDNGGAGNPPTGGGGGGGSGNDGPQTKNQGFHFDMLRGDGSIIGDYITPVVTSYESGTLTRPNSRSPWKFQSFSFSNIGIQGRLLLEVWTASSLNAISNIESDGSYASMNHTWQLARNAALGEIIIPGAITYTTHQNDYGYNAN